jgi:hypothetical protein
VARATQTSLAGSVHDSVGNRFLVAGIALDVLSWLTREKSDVDRLADQWQRLRKPSLFLVSLQPRDADADLVALVDARFSQTVALLQALDLGCEPAHTKSTTFGGAFIVRGSYAPGLMHARYYLCGYPGQVDVGAYTTQVQQRPVVAQVLGTGATPNEYDGGTFALVSLDRLTDLAPVVQSLDPEGRLDPERLPGLLAKRIRAHLPTGWLAVYTTTGDDGKRWVAVTTADGERLFELPPRPR